MTPRQLWSSCVWTSLRSQRCAHILVKSAEQHGIHFGLSPACTLLHKCSRLSCTASTEHEHTLPLWFPDLKRLWRLSRALRQSQYPGCPGPQGLKAVFGRPSSERCSHHWILLPRRLPPPVHTQYDQALHTEESSVATSLPL